MSDLDQVIRLVQAAADEAVYGTVHRTRSDEVSAAVRAAFECAIGNGLVRLAPSAEWPEYVAMRPPYVQPFGG